MERFREHEKEFKMKQYSKRALAANQEHMSNFVQANDSDDSHSYGIEDSDENQSNNDSNVDYNEDEYGHRESGDFSELGEGARWGGKVIAGCLQIQKISPRYLQEANEMRFPKGV